MTRSDSQSAEARPELSVKPREFAFLKERFGDAVASYQVFRGDLSIRVDPASIVHVIRSLRDDFQPSYNYLSYVTADHWIESQTPGPAGPPLFMIHYGLQSIPSPGTRLRLIVTVKDTPDATVPSVTSVHEGANWHEREVFDLFGITFSGHPNLTRILTPETYEEHPLRRDFPIDGPGVIEFQDRLVAEWNVAEERDYLGKFGDPWIRKIQEQQSGRIYLKRLGDSFMHETEMELPGDIGYSEQKVPDLIIGPKKEGLEKEGKSSGS